ncbi:sensor histidine kinase [Porphyrobacter sp. AAP60]|uniref:sensor histidine kinase n=1 Tax=Porphyrobacter sp. AAP60 TaxID=1523423 RepID=UPI0006B8B32B|nr:HWE histidine kinase domain-containing protein [Porphyrobacter sp. AAP60]
MVESIAEQDRSRKLARWIEGFPTTRFGPVFNLLVTLAIVGIAWLVRVALDGALPPGFPFLTFFPAVVVTAFVFGVRLGSLSALLCGLLAWYFFFPPVGTFELEGNEVAIGLYLFVVATDLALIYGMQAANQQLRRERENSRDLAASKERMVEQLEQQVAERRQAAVALRESEVKIRLATQAAGIGLWQWHVESGIVHWDSTLFELYGLSPTPDGSVQYTDYLARLHPDDAAEQDRVLQETISNCGESTREFRIIRGDDGSVRHLRAVEAARAGPDGTTEWLVGSNLDITEEKNRERLVQILMGEINHRAKNLLAVVLSVAKLTSGDNHEEFLLNFAARIRSLAAGQDLLVGSEWKGVHLHDLVSAQLGHFKGLIDNRIILAGDDVSLSPPSVQTIGMAIHELVTNASKYGALATAGGRIALTWRRVGSAPDERFVMTWVETGGPPVIAPERLGFGSTVTKDMVEMSLDAEVESDFGPSGFSWKLDCPLENIIEQEGSGLSAERHFG